MLGQYYKSWHIFLTECITKIYYLMKAIKYFCGNRIVYCPFRRSLMLIVLKLYISGSVPLKNVRISVISRIWHLGNIECGNQDIKNEVLAILSNTVGFCQRNIYTKIFWSRSLSLSSTVHHKCQMSNNPGHKISLMWEDFCLLIPRSLDLLLFRVSFLLCPYLLRLTLSCLE